MRKVLKWIFRILLIYIGLFLILSFALYIPFVQEKACDIVEKKVSAAMNMDLSIGKLRLYFPLTLNINQASITNAPQDTMLRVQELAVDVSILPLFKKEVQVNKIQLSGAYFHFVDSAQTMEIAAKLDLLNLSGNVIQLSNDEIDLGQAVLSNGSVAINVLKSKQDTTTTQSGGFPWKIVGKRILLRNVQVHFADLPSGFSTNVQVENASLKKGMVDLLNQKVIANSIRISNGKYTIIMPESTDSTNVQTTTLPADTVSSLPWEISLAKAYIENNYYEMHIGGYQSDSNRFDTNHMFIRNININADSLYNRGITSYMTIKSVTAELTPELAITQFKGYAKVDTNALEVKDVQFKTKYSKLNFNGSLDWTTINNSFGIKKLALLANGELATNDIYSLLGANPVDSILPENAYLTLDANIRGRNNQIEINQLQMNYPHCFSIEANGLLSSIHNFKRLGGNLHFDFRGYDPESFEKLLPVTLKKTISFPEKFSLSAHIIANNGQVAPTIDVQTPKGKINIGGDLNIDSEVYDLTLKSDTFSVKQFLPSMGIDLVDGTFKADGKGFDFFKQTTKTQLDLNLNRLDLMDYTYRGLVVNASLLDSYLKLNGKMLDKDLNFETTLTGTIKQDLINVELALDANNINLQALKIWNSPFKTAFEWKTTFVTDLKQKFGGKGDIQIQELEFMNSTYPKISLNYDVMNSDSLFYAYMNSGDMRFEAHSPKSILASMTSLENANKKMSKQLNTLHINFAELKEFYPDVNFKLTAGKNNIINAYLAQDYMFIGSTFVQGMINPQEGLRLNCLLNDFQSKQNIIDTIQFVANQDSNKINFDFVAANRLNNPQFTFHLCADGFVDEKGLTLKIHETNQKGVTGLDLGFVVGVEDQALRLNLFPETPIIANRPWKLNANNYISISKTKQISADLLLSGDIARIHAYSVDSTRGHDGIILDIDGINLQEISKSIPYLPQMQGLLNTQLGVYSENQMFNSNGSFQIVDFIYNNQNVGNIKLDAAYSVNERKEPHIKSALYVDNKEAMVVTGTLNDSTKQGMNLKVDFLKLPLKTANPFIPNDLLSLNGYLVGNISMVQNGKDPLINGELKLDSTSLYVIPANSTFTLDQQPIYVRDNFIKFDSYKLYSSKNSPLVLTGDVDLRRLDYIYTDLTLKGTNFQLLNAPQTEKSMVYGKAFININTTVKGALNRLVVRGNLNLLNQTNLTYVMQESALDTQNKMAQLVRFVNFSDTANVVFGKIQKINELEGMDLLFVANIDQGVKLNIDLSTDGSNRVNLIGGGVLTYLMNREGTNSLSGQYALTGGTVVYNIPVIGAKVFNIQEGSNVQWNGNLLNPVLNITAIEKIRASVSDGGGTNNSQIVTFNAIVRIQNPLESMSIVFDASAPDNLTWQNKLASQTLEQRGQTAMNLILYGAPSFGGGGGSASNTATNALTGFLESQVNQWARNNLKGVNLSFGVENFAQNSGNRTDYSVQFSKSFLNDRFTVNVGGRVSTGSDPEIAKDQNFIDDLSIDYRLDKSGNLYMKLFHHTNYDNILEGKITETGLGVAIRRKLYKFRNIFRFRAPKAVREQRAMERQAEKRKKEEEDKTKALTDPALYEPKKSND
ncbi:MAG: translocation/assembly module TamB domain-containing protein [Bacteroidales bacterium]